MASDDCWIINDITPVFRPYLRNVYQDLKIGLCNSKVDFENIFWSAENTQSQFRIILPYCSKRLKWDVIFDSSTPWVAPDFRFDDDSFLNNIDEELLQQKLPSLSKWNENDPKALSDVLSELINLYKIYQIKKLNEDDNRASFEYSALLSDGFTSEDIEVWVGGRVVEFLIRLKVDTSRLPELYKENGNEKNPGKDSALLLVRYSNFTNTELILSPLLSKALGNIALPTMHQSGALMDYVPMVTELLNKKVKDLLDNEILKRELLAQLIVKYEGALLEHHANNAAFLFEMNDFHWILQIDLGKFNGVDSGRHDLN